MQVVRELTEIRSHRPSSVTVGVFDGVHVGHRELISGMVAAAHAAGQAAVAYTFDPHPSAAMGRTPPPQLTTLDERTELLAALGLDLLVVPPFTAATARTRAREFASLLVGSVGMVELWAGPDFALGHRREGDVRFLTRLGDQMGFRVLVVAPSTCQGRWVSSSEIREALLTGELDWANRCLGRPYRLTTTVTHELALPGGTGVSMIAARAAPHRLVPGAGVYACVVHTRRSRDVRAVAYLGDPGDEFGQSPSADVHIFQPGDELPRGRLHLEFVALLRGGLAGPPGNLPQPILLDDVRQAEERLDAHEAAAAGSGSGELPAAGTG